MSKNLKPGFSLKKLSMLLEKDFWQDFFEVAKKKYNDSETLQKIQKRILSHRWTIFLRQKFENLDWKGKMIVLISAAALFVFLIAPYSLLFRESGTLIAESEKRGQSLIQLLANSNQVAFSEDMSVFYSTTSVIHELGVKDAWITDTEGNILAPAERFGKSMTKNKIKGSSQGCTRWNLGLDYEFACPIFKWVEKDAGFQKQIVGYAYMDYTVAASLNFLTHRGFQIFKYITWFLACFGVLAYGLIMLIKKPLLDFKFELRAFARGSKKDFIPPKNFPELTDLANEIREVIQSQKSVMPQSTHTGTTNWRNILTSLHPFLAKNVLYIDGEKNVSYASPELTSRFQITEGSHLIRALQNFTGYDDLMDFLSRVMESPQHSVVETIPDIGSIGVVPHTQNGITDYLLFFDKE